jgi:hypothetical protein
MEQLYIKINLPRDKKIYVRITLCTELQSKY